MIDRKNESTFLENTQKHKTPGQTIEAEISFIIISYATSKKILQSRDFYVLHRLITRLCVDARLPAISKIDRVISRSMT